MPPPLCQLLLNVILFFIPSISWSASRLNIVIIVADDWGGLMLVLTKAFTDARRPVI